MPAKKRRPRPRRRERRAAMPHTKSSNTQKSRTDRVLDLAKIAVGLAAVISNFFKP